MTESKKSGGWLKHAAGAFITVACVVVIARQVKLDEVLAAIRHFDWPYLVFGVAFLAFGYSLRVLRWSLLLGATGAPVRFGNCLAPFLGSIALNNVLPLRLGDLVRAFVFPAAMGVPKTTATSSLVMERLIDLMTLLCCLAIGLFAIRTAQVPAMISESALTLAVLGGLALVLTFLFSGALARALEKAAAGQPAGKRLAGVLATVAGLLRGFEAMSRLRVLVSALLISMLVWVGESGLFYFMMRGCGLDASPPMALLVMAIATLSTLVPSSPGYVGPFHLAAFTAISLVGGSAAQAGSFAVLCHLALWLPTTLAGAIAILFRPELFRVARGAKRSEVPIN
ncbi:lysylphosphatidylglycerol synthase transmembrane domain-containing protein [Massilia sp.]|uniref:lysylphosphatidylglycerol synthase transmembrane domain-containing protein n=1 Tax=Massilia sp. TaxID=1882437 RepID=UPI0028AB0C2E|nr:lysylphosphatidylglycerol synthase transmembrane domain-containing protein [Massilia sp.]